MNCCPIVGKLSDWWGSQYWKRSKCNHQYATPFLLHSKPGRSEPTPTCWQLCGQNKNRYVYVMQYLAWRVMVGLNQKITLSFLIVGHTKFSPHLLGRQARGCSRQGHRQPSWKRDHSCKRHQKLTTYQQDSRWNGGSTYSTVYGNLLLRNVKILCAPTHQKSLPHPLHRRDIGAINVICIT